MRLNSIARARWLGPALFALLLVVAGALVGFARNPAPFFENGFYGEDARWIDQILNHGLLYAVVWGRPDYPVAIPVLLDWLAVVADKLVFGDNMGPLPKLVAISAYLFYAFCCYAAYWIVAMFRGRRAGLCAWLLLLLLPASDLNLTFGHNLQWQFLIPLLTVYFLLLGCRYPGFKFACYLAAGVTFISFPPAIAIGLFFLLWKMYLPWRETGRTLPKAIAAYIKRLDLADWALALMAFDALLQIVTRGGFTTGSDRLGPFEPAHSVEYLLYRVFAYPFTMRYIDGFNDFWTLLFVAVFAGGALVWGSRQAGRAGQSRPWLFLLAAFAIYWVLFGISRRGFSHVVDYHQVWIQHYYFGLNFFAVMVMVIGLWPGTAPRSSQRILSGALLTILCLSMASQWRIIFQIDNRRGLPSWEGNEWHAKIAEARREICKADCSDASLARESRRILTYPIDENKTWGITLNWQQLNASYLHSGYAENNDQH